MAAKRRSTPKGNEKELTRAAKALRESKHLITQSRELRKQSEQLIEAMLKEAGKARRGPS